LAVFGHCHLRVVDGNVRKPLVDTQNIVYDIDMETKQIHTDFDLCYRALCSRDARFDGLFFSAVTSTGIYCRPICPAQVPQVRHIRFYSCAAAAESAGFRACRRCHPEASPGSPDWNVRADLVARALRLIADGLVDAEGVAGLAQRLAVSERHLHRELVAQIGVGPLALARSRRAQTAKLLIDQTQLPLTTIAFTSGFASIRQFNETMQEVFRCAPSEMRRHIQPGRAADGRLTLRLHYRPPFNIEELLAYLSKRAIPGVEEVIDQRYRRTIAFPRSKGILEVEPIAKKNALAIHLYLDDLSDLSRIVQRCRNLFDLDADPAAINATLAADPIMAPLVEERPGLRIPGTINGFELAARAILEQQVSITRARTLATRLVTTCGDRLPEPRGTLTHFFPTPEQIMSVDPSTMGLPPTRAAALRALAQAVVEGDLILDRNADREQTVNQLHKLPGIGPGTASYIAMRALGDPDAFPTSDLGLRHAFTQRGLATDQKSIGRYAEAWRPWRAYAAHHLWENLAVSMDEPSGTLQQVV
jgi:AraC family transcriptional regulator of adaptative response / DNA-3-methyladenine glycosylase II